MTNKKTLKPNIKMIAIYLLLALAALAFVTARYKITTFGEAKIDEIIFYLFNGLEGSNTSSFRDVAIGNIFFFLIVFGILALPVIGFFHNRIIYLKNPLKKKSAVRQIKLRNISRPRHQLIYAVIVSAISIAYLLSTLSFGNFIKAQFESSKIYENEYIRPEEVDLEFPEQKRNLIFVYLESMENTVASKANGGSGDISYIPELENLVLDPENISFSNTSNPIGGGTNLNSTTWTVAALSAQMGGVQLKNTIGYDRNDMGAFNNFIPGAYTLGDVLQRQGYNQTFMIGSEAKFGGRDKLFSQHGSFTILDLNSAKQTGKLAEDYHVWWGFEDKKLFEYAKEEASRLAGEDKPFNLQLLTVDTHFVDGYLDETCPAPYAQKYLNVYACSSRQVADFVNWVQSQPFADNTTIVLSGDHLGMQTEFYAQMINNFNPGYQRTLYNVIINPAITEVPDTVRYNRQYSSMDMYPTTLAAIGVDIPGERLGLGTNLFSGEQTLVEKYGLSKLNEELAKRSGYYNRNILSARKK